MIDRQLTPKQIVTELDKYIIGQDKAKKSVAIAMRNRWRRQHVTSDLKEEIMPNNIIMIGPTGVGKTEIARRLANLAGAPFLKVEASKFTEVGYVGRDVESMIRDLTDLAINMVKKEKAERVQTKAEHLAEERTLDALLPPPPSMRKKGVSTNALTVEQKQAQERWRRTREKLRAQLKDGLLDERQMEIEVPNDRFPIIEIFSPMGMEELGVNFQEMFSGMMPQKTKRRRVAVKEAKKIFAQQETQKLIDMEAVISDATARMENSGIIFVDELDKIAGERSKMGPDVSREGVQRDLLPIVEGCNVMTKYGLVRTDHILFIAAGAFHISKPSDLIPEMQGRFPIRVEQDSLTAGEFVRIHPQPKNAQKKQYIAMLETDGVEVSFTKEAIREIARIATVVNERAENIGARRLHTVMTTLLEEIMFEAPDNKKKKIRISKDMVAKSLTGIVEDEDLSRYIL